MKEFAQPEDLRVCLVQFEIFWEDFQANWNMINTMLKNEAGKHDLIILPEMFNSGFTMKPENVAEPVGGHTENFMKFLASKFGAIVMGSVITEEGGKYYNRLLVVSQDGPVTKYDKRHLFTMAGEHEVYTSGAELNVFSLKGWRICPMVCYDLRFPVWSRNGMREDGRPWYDLLVYVANWPSKRATHWNTLLQARAIENQACAIGVNRIGSDENGFEYQGDSSVFDARGTLLAQGGSERKLVTATLNWEEVEAYRKKFPALADADKFGLYA